MKFDEAELVKTSIVPNIVIVLNALYQGHEIKLAGRSIWLVKNKHDSECIITDAIRESSGDKIVIGLGHWTLEQFTLACNKLTEEEIQIIQMNCVLNRGLETGAYSTR